jgi:predicted RNA-binding Zn ribbon-like protein
MISPAKTLPDPFFIAEHRALDYLNTVAAPAGEILDWLADGAAFFDWLRRGFAVPADLKISAANLQRIAADARDLREWFRELVQKHAGRPLPASIAGALEPLNAILQHGQLHFQLSRGEPLILEEAQNWRAPQALLQPIARAIADLLCHADFSQVRHCEGAQCTLWFIDVSKSHRRRWCSMSVCGNRAKAAQHRAKNSG